MIFVDILEELANCPSGSDKNSCDLENRHQTVFLPQVTVVEMETGGAVDSLLLHVYTSSGWS